MNSPKVSIIVPIYNVENYINRCVDSILNQSYKNLEIILVDDGSPDRCGEIIDKYAEKDNRIKTIHKTNGGLSDARNFGIKEVTSELTLFVDSDDWLEEEMLSCMVDNMNKYNADVVQAGFYYAYKDYLLYDDRYYSEKDKPIELNNTELMKELVINNKVKNFAWGKLYKTDLIKSIPFEKGMLFEDVFWAHQVMAKVNKYVILHKPLSYYLQREDSIVATYTVRNLDILKGLKVRHKFIEEKYSQLRNESFKIILNTSFLHYNLLAANKDKDSDGIYRNEVRKYILDNYNDFKIAIKEDKDMSLQLGLFKLNGSLNAAIPFKNKVLRKLKIKKEAGLRRVEISK